MRYRVCVIVMINTLFSFIYQDNIKLKIKNNFSTIIIQKLNIKTNYFIYYDYCQIYIYDS